MRKATPGWFILDLDPPGMETVNADFDALAGEMFC